MRSPMSHPRQSPTVLRSWPSFPVFGSARATFEVVGNTGKVSSEKAGVGSPRIKGVSVRFVRWQKTTPICHKIVYLLLNFRPRETGLSLLLFRFENADMRSSTSRKPYARRASIAFTTSRFVGDTLLLLVNKVTTDSAWYLHVSSSSPWQN